MTVPALLARIRSAADAEMGLMLTPDDVILLDAEVFRLTQAVEDLRRVCDFTRGQVEELTANGVSIAKAEDKAYRQGYTDGQDDERAAVVEWLRDPSTSPYVGVLADDIDHGEHRRKVQP